ncbi:MAG: carbohydrate kinase family protein [Candidatus Methanoperedens sp.]|nr:carbohydrate kinase family protein [Candidatus Methanoperedens sp.]MCE8427055.1 carbohydrate kinase family protein [Candidatus Methanoperedens sp.]
MLRDEKSLLTEKLKNYIPEEYKVTLMPHFCVDNFIRCDESYDSFIEKFKKTATQGGGNTVMRQMLHIGGKATNCASALDSLGLNPCLIAKTDILGYKLLEYFLEGKNVDISHVSRDGELAFTTAIELEGVNIMFSFPGVTSQFGPEYLTEDDEELIRESDMVCISDWGLNNCGTKLARYVFSLVKKEGKGKTFFDPGDPSPKKEREEVEVKGIKNMLKQGLVDILSVNENELIRYGGIDFLRKVTRVDMHTEKYVKTFYNDKETEEIPAFNVEPKRLTGAGDAWNSGDILGEAMGLSDELRLLLANSVAAYYISDLEGKHPTRQDLIKL